MGNNLLGGVSRRDCAGSGLLRAVGESSLLLQDTENEEQSKVYKLGRGVCLVLSVGDITKWGGGSQGAIVNAADEQMLGGGGVDGAIHRAAGDGLLHACHQVPEVRPGVRCPTGEARVTDAFDLPVAKIIHTVGPVHPQASPEARTLGPVIESNAQADALLKSAYISSLQAAAEQSACGGNQIVAVAFPALSCGIFGFPVEQAAYIAVSTVVGYFSKEQTHVTETDWEGLLKKAQDSNEHNRLRHVEFVLRPRTFFAFVVAAQNIIPQQPP